MPQQYQRPTLKQAQLAMAEGAELLKQANAEIAKLHAELHQYKLREYNTKLARAMIQKNLHTSFGANEEEVVSNLMKQSHMKLASIAEAVNLAAPNNPFAYLDDSNPSAGTGQANRDASPFVQYMMGNLS